MYCNDGWGDLFIVVESPTRREAPVKILVGLEPLFVSPGTRFRIGLEFAKPVRNRY